MIFFAGRIERDAAFLQIGVLAQVRGQRRTVTADDVGVGRLPRLHTVEEVADVLLFERLGVLALDRRGRSRSALGHLLVSVTTTVNVEPAIGAHQFQRRAARAGNQRGVKRGDPFVGIFELDADRVRRGAPVVVGVYAAPCRRRYR